MIQALPKAFMKRSKLGNKLSKERHIVTQFEYKHIGSNCSNFLKWSKKYHFSRLNIKDVNENKQF